MEGSLLGKDEETEVKERPTDIEGQRKEEDISNSLRHAVFPWQLGFHRNNLAKDAISMGKKSPYLHSTAPYAHKYRNIHHLRISAAYLQLRATNCRFGSLDAATPLHG